MSTTSLKPPLSNWNSSTAFGAPFEPGNCLFFGFFVLGVGNREMASGTTDHRVDPRERADDRTSDFDCVMTACKLRQQVPFVGLSSRPTSPLALLIQAISSVMAGASQLPVRPPPSCTGFLHCFHRRVHIEAVTPSRDYFALKRCGSCCCGAAGSDLLTLSPFSGSPLPSEIACPTCAPVVGPPTRSKYRLPTARLQ